jgi:SAM-dependent methyltransferase
VADPSTDKSFTGSIPKNYEAFLVPLIFVPYAVDLSRRVASLRPSHVLEVAAGTGVVTRALVTALPGSTDIVATDLNPAMIEQAAAIGTSRPVEWKVADATDLPFSDEAFDVVVCQFGVMFFPDKPKAFGEFRRVLKPGGTLIFSVWDELGANEFADAISTGLAEHFPSDPPRFLPRSPYGYFEHARIKADLAAGGFTMAPEIETITERSRAKSAVEPALGFCHGSPLRTEIDARGDLTSATNAAVRELEKRFGSGHVDAQMRAHVVTVTN